MGSARLLKNGLWKVWYHAGTLVLREQLRRSAMLRDKTVTRAREKIYARMWGTSTYLAA